MNSFRMKQGCSFHAGPVQISTSHHRFESVCRLFRKTTRSIAICSKSTQRSEFWCESTILCILQKKRKYYLID